MSMSRRLLYASEVWEIVRPRTALTAGHLLIRLTNPAIAFDLRSAADWLVCHNAARQALADVLGATRCTVVFAHQWHPIGASIGEPEVESSTPTFHLFGRWDGEPVTPGEQLLLPTQRRVPAAADRLAEYDGGLRAALRRLGCGTVSRRVRDSGGCPSAGAGGVHSPGKGRPAPHCPVAGIRRSRPHARAPAGAGRRAAGPDGTPRRHRAELRGAGPGRRAAGSPRPGPLGRRVCQPPAGISARYPKLAKPYCDGLIISVSMEA